MEGADNTEEERYSPGERYGRVYQINYARCILCGLCIEACPTRALTMTNEFELADTLPRERSSTPRSSCSRGLEEGMVDSPHSIFPGTDEQDYYRGLVTEAAPGTVRQVAVSKGEAEEDAPPARRRRRNDRLAAASTTSTGEAVQFWVLGTVAVIGALCTILMRRAVHSALCLAGTMIVLAVFYLANGAYFLGVVQIVVYTGAIMMLFLFVVMLVGVTAADSLKETLKGQRWSPPLCGLGFGILLIAGIGNASLKTSTAWAQANAGGNVEGLAALHLHQVRLRLRDHRRAADHGGRRRDGAHPPGAHRAGQDPARAVRGARPRGQALPPLPAPGVYARHNAVDIAGLLPDGTPSELSVSQTLRERGQIRDVSSESLAELKALEERRPDRAALGAPNEHKQDQEMNPVYYLYLAALLFTIGAAGVLIRRNAIVVFMCIDLGQLLQELRSSLRKS